MKSPLSVRATRPSAIPAAPRLSLCDKQGKVKPIDAQTLRIDFGDGCSLMLDLSGTSGPAALAIVALHTDPAQRARLTLRLEHYDSVTLQVDAEAEPVQATMPDIPDAGHQAALDLTVQYGDEIDSALRKTLPKRKQIAAWLGSALFSRAALTVRFVGATEGRALNQSYRHKGSPTNVLTFAYGHTPDGELNADLVLCCPVVEQEAAQQHKPLTAHYAHLLIHGALHAQGYDHENSKKDALEMEALEIDILAKLKFPNPYR